MEQDQPLIMPPEVIDYAFQANNAYDLWKIAREGDKPAHTEDSWVSFLYLEDLTLDAIEKFIEAKQKHHNLSVVIPESP